MIKQRAIISLGSNLGNRLELLQKALILLENQSIQIKTLSSIYETPAWGFESTPFYNACAEIETDFTPEALLLVFLKIEKQLGRFRNSSAGYSARQLDIDLLFYGDLLSSAKNLILPHPRLHLRNFVLVPLHEIAPYWLHPGLNATVEELLHKSTDRDQLKKLPFEKWSPSIFNSFSYITIEGNIGVGKSTLAQKIANTFKVPLLQEAFAKNPYLEKFYKDPEVYALPVEQFFLDDRLQQMQEFWQQNKANAVSDYTILKSLIFARQNLNKKDFENYRNRFEKIYPQQKKPDLLIYLYTDIDQLLEQIKRRGRPYEQQIKRTYLEKIEEGYLKLIKSQLEYPVLSIDTKSLDFEKSENDFQDILRLIIRASL